MECILGLTTLENDKIKSIFLDYIVTVDFMRRKDAHEYLTHTIVISIFLFYYFVI
ncbi:hypothetical protein CULT_2770001 [[Clostridium] ultunense Esp]|nr:hypothetical protein CULT_2770001 [[Clostridium] ultunense Esp]